MKDWLPLIAVFALTGGAISYFVTDGFAFNRCNEGAAYDAIQAQMAQYLKAPSTAIYQPWGQVSERSGSLCSFNVSGYVESQNSFGAMGKSTFSTKVFLSADKDWRVYPILLNGSFPGL